MKTEVTQSYEDMKKEVTQSYADTKKEITPNYADMNKQVTQSYADMTKEVTQNYANVKKEQKCYKSILIYSGYVTQDCTKLRNTKPWESVQEWLTTHQPKN